MVWVWGGKHPWKYISYDATYGNSYAAAKLLAFLYKLMERISNLVSAPSQRSGNDDLYGVVDC